MMVKISKSERIVFLWLIWLAVSLLVASNAVIGEDSLSQVPSIELRKPNSWSDLMYPPRFQSEEPRQAYPTPPEKPELQIYYKDYLIVLPDCTANVKVSCSNSDANDSLALWLDVKRLTTFLDAASQSPSAIQSLKPSLDSLLEYQAGHSARELRYRAALINASVLWALASDFDVAEELLHRAQEIEHRLLTPKDFRTLAVLNNLGMTYSGQARYDKAEKCLEEAIEIREKGLYVVHLSDDAYTDGYLHTNGYFKQVLLMIRLLKVGDLRLHAAGTPHDGVSDKDWDIYVYVESALPKLDDRLEPSIAALFLKDASLFALHTGFYEKTHLSSGDYDRDNLIELIHIWGSNQPGLGIFIKPVDESIELLHAYAYYLSCLSLSSRCCALFIKDVEEIVNTLEKAVEILTAIKQQVSQSRKADLVLRQVNIFLSFVRNNKPTVDGKYGKKTIPKRVSHCLERLISEPRSKDQFESLYKCLNDSP